MQNCALIGYGRFGKNIYNTLKKISWVPEIVCDLDLRNPPDCKTTKNIDDIINSDIKNIFLATPAATHFEIAKQILEAKKNLFIEKPITLSTETCNELVSLANSNKCILHADYTFLFSPQTEFLLTQEIGDVISAVSYRTNWGALDTGVSVIQDLAVHCVSLALHLFGYPNIVQAFGMLDKITNNYEEAVILLKYQNYDFKSIVSRKSLRKIRTLEIHHTGGSLLTDYNSQETYRSDGLHEPWQIILADKMQPLEKEILYFRNVLDGGCKPILTSFHSQVSYILEQIESSLQNCAREEILDDPK